MKYIALIAISFLLSACNESGERVYDSSYNTICVRNVTYLTYSTGLSVMLDSNSKVVPCMVDKSCTIGE